jgi:hypothetical protein
MVVVLGCLVGIEMIVVKIDFFFKKTATTEIYTESQDKLVDTTIYPLQRVKNVPST